MAFANVIRRAAARAMPLAVRTAGSQRCYHLRSCSTPFFTATPTNSCGALPQKLFRSSITSTIHRFSTKSKSDDTLVKVIEAEIQCAQESDDHDKFEDIPSNFPFKIEDEPGLQTVTLTRKYQSESITVVVHMPHLITGEKDDSDDDDSNDDDSETGNQSQLPMVVRVSKYGEPCLEFGVTAYADEIAIDSLSIKDPDAGEDQIAYEGPDFGDLDENLQMAFHKYLDIRGINLLTTNLLHEYMINKDSKEYVGWLKKVKKFVQS